MADLHEQTADSSQGAEQRLWDMAVRLRDEQATDLTGVRPTYGNLLHELEKHQGFIEADNLAHPDREPLVGTLTFDELQALARLRKSFPSDEDRIWQSSFTRLQ